MVLMCISIHDLRGEFANETMTNESWTWTSRRQSEEKIHFSFNIYIGKNNIRVKGFVLWKHNGSNVWFHS